jgi:hypothetical protein
MQSNDESRRVRWMHKMMKRRLSTAGQLTCAMSRRKSVQLPGSTTYPPAVTSPTHALPPQNFQSHLFLGFLLDSANHAIKSSVKSIKSIRGAFTPPSARYRFTGSLLFHLPEAMNLFSYHYIRPVCFSSTWLFAL